MPGNQFRTELAYSVGQGHTTLVPLPQEAQPAPPLGYAASGAPSINVRFFGGPIGASTYRSGVYVPENKAIYCLPYGLGTNVLKIDPVAETVAFIGGAAAGRVYYGAIRAPNGAIYGIPSSAATTAIGKFDPTTETLSTFGNVGGATANKWERGCLAPNGKIYCAPSTSTTVLVIDPTNDTATTFGSFAGSTKWAGAVLANNGKIYCIPYGSDSILVIDPNTDTATTFGTVQQYAGNPGSTGKWNGGVIAADGKIYCSPYNASNVLVIDPETNTLSAFNFNWFYPQSGVFTSAVAVPAFGSYYIDNQRYSVANSIVSQAPTLAANGRMYSAAAFSDANGNLRNAVYEIDPVYKNTTVFRSSGDFSQLTQSGGTSPFLVTCMVADGSIICIPYFAQQVMKITGLPPASADMITMPTNIAGNLTGSSYNRHSNK